MRRSTYISIICIAIVCGCVLVQMGCAVLSTSQVQEVKRFSEATDAFTELPGTLARSYGALVRDSDLLALSRQEFSASDPNNAENAWKKIVQAYDKEHKFIDAGDRMDSALKVLKTYSLILSQLVSDNYTNEIGENAAKLGKSLNDSIGDYNKSYRTENPLPSIGGDIAKSIRLVGGLYIRYRQAQVLKETIGKANPLVQGLMNDVKTVADKFASDYKAYETTHLETPFKELAIASHRLTINTVLTVYNDLSRARAGAELARNINSAATTYAAAHQALVDKTRKRMEFKEIISEIQTLSNEVKAAQDTKAKVEK